MVGLRYGRLLGIDFSHTRGGHALWRFACDCGNETIADGTAVRSGKTSSCGCLHREICAERLTVHGRRAARRHDLTYRAWQEINTYCSNPASPRYREFGARGVVVCQEWRESFEAFLADMDERPEDFGLTRLDEAKGFSPGNCIWEPLRSRAQRAIDSPQMSGGQQT